MISGVVHRHDKGEIKSGLLKAGICQKCDILATITWTQDRKNVWYYRLPVFQGRQLPLQYWLRRTKGLLFIAWRISVSRFNIKTAFPGMEIRIMNARRPWIREIILYC